MDSGGQAVGGSLDVKRIFADEQPVDLFSDGPTA